MTYEFFNTSLLAFGKKITSAFKSLNDLKKAADDNIAQVLQDLRVFNQYGNKNYKVPTPYSGDRPARTDELFNIVSQPYYFRTLEYKNGFINISGVAFNKSTKRITSFTGSSNIKEGSVYYSEAISNNTTGSELRFYTKGDVNYKGGVRLFDYRIEDNKIVLSGDISNLNFQVI